MIFRYFVRKNAPYENADFKFIASGEELEMTTRNRGAERTSLSTAKATSSTQRLQTCTEAATKYYNYTANETDEKRKHRLAMLSWCFKKRSGDATLEVYSQDYLLRCNDRQQELHDLYNACQEYLSNGLRTADQPLHLEQQWVLQ